MATYRNAFWLLVVLIFASFAWNYLQTPNSGSTAYNSSNYLVVTGGPGSYWGLVKAGAEAAAKELKVNVTIRMPEHAENLADQMQILSSLNAEEWGGIAISPLDAEQQTHLINRLAAKTGVLTFDSDAPLSNRLGYVGTSNYGAGMRCAQLVHEALPTGGKLAVLMANYTKANMVERKSGLEENINRLLPGDNAGELASYEIIDFLVDEGSNETCANHIREVLSQHADLSCFVGLNERHGPILLSVLKELGKLDRIQLVTFDHDAATLEGIKAGHIFATIAQDPYNFGYESVRILATRTDSKPEEVSVIGRGSWHVSTEVIRQDSVEEFQARLEKLKVSKPDSASEG